MVLLDWPPPWEQLVREYADSLKLPKLAEGKSSYKFVSGIPLFPLDLELRSYQEKALLSWLENRGRGTLKMATGSGKTITALALTTHLYEKINLQVLLVICPYRHLVKQWGRESERFNLRPILAFESVHTWESQLANELYNLNANNQKFLCIITTNSTFITESFQSQLQFFPERTLLVGDEAHNLGTLKLEECLPRNIGLRLALSATPERYFDEQGTATIFNYFGAVLQPEFTLKNALEEGALTNYLYYPVFVELTEAEALVYARLTQRIGWLVAKQDGWVNNETLTGFLMQRSRLVGAAENKLKALRELMQGRLDTYHTLFYCGDGYVDNYDGDSRRQISAVTRLLGKELGYKVNTYIAETTLEEREKICQQFANKELQGLVAIRCLDEGVDIPSITTAVIMASSGNPRQFIQRRGRILRTHPGKKYATLFDMIVIPPQLDRETWEVERNLLKKELKRFVEFAQLALNAAEARDRLGEILERFSLSTLDPEEC
jgi:DNA phosphorothioation system restriction enzyme